MHNPLSDPQTINILVNMFVALFYASPFLIVLVCCCSQTISYVHIQGIPRMCCHLISTLRRLISCALAMLIMRFVIGMSPNLIAPVSSRLVLIYSSFFLRCFTGYRIGFVLNLVFFPNREVQHK